MCVELIKLFMYQKARDKDTKKLGMNKVTDQKFQSIGAKMTKKMQIQVFHDLKHWTAKPVVMPCPAK